LRKAVVEGFLKKVHAKKVLRREVTERKPSIGAEGQTLTTTAAVLSSEQLKMLVTIATGAPKQVQKICQQMGLSRAQARRIAKRLESMTVIIPHRFATGRLGGQWCFYEITDYGWLILEQKGISRPKPLTNGDFEHELAARLVEEEGKSRAFATEFEVDIGGLRLDAAWICRKSGDRILFNIGISRPGHEVDCVEKFLKMPLARTFGFVLVVRDSSFRRKVQAILKKRDPKGDIHKRVEIKLIADFVH
jgi:hypothetical protein